MSIGWSIWFGGKFWYCGSRSYKPDQALRQDGSLVWLSPVGAAYVLWFPFFDRICCCVASAFVLLCVGLGLRPVADLQCRLSLSLFHPWWIPKTWLSFCSFRDLRARGDNPKERTENIPPKKRRYQCGKEALEAVLMNEESISSKRETRTTSERHNNKKILATTERE